MKNSKNIQDFADFLKNWLTSPKAKRFLKNTKGDKKVREILENVQILSEVNAALAKEVEFMAADEIDKKVFLERYEEIEQRFSAKLAGRDKRNNAR